MNAHARLAMPGEDTAKAWLKILARYRQPQLKRSVFELLVTVIPFLVLWSLIYVSVIQQFWAGLALIIPTAGFLLRLFIIQHDCGHDSFFGRRSLDTWTGRTLGVLTLTPYDYWRHSHALHHASTGNLDERGIGDITTLTVREYQALPWLRRLSYRLYRHPLVMFGIGPAWIFLFKQRLPLGLMNAGSMPWISTMGTNLSILILATLMIWAVGLIPFLLIHLPVVLLAGAAGVWLFYVQHQFEETHWSNDEEWEFPRAALHGASHYDLPAALRWLSGNIGVHHIHHLSSRIPFYRLPEVLRDYPELAGVGRITIWQSLGCVRLALWDEQSGRLVSFREAAQNRTIS